MDLVSSLGATGFMVMALGVWGLLVAIAVSLDKMPEPAAAPQPEPCPRCSRPARRIVLSAGRSLQLAHRHAATRRPSLQAHGM